MNRCWFKSIVSVIVGMTFVTAIKEGKDADAKEHTHRESPVPTHPLTNGFFVVTSTSATLR